MRPLGVTILAILGIISGILTIIFAGMLVALFSVIPISKLEDLGTLFSLILASGSTFLVIMGIVTLVISYGLWKGASWAWWIYVILLALGIVSSLLSLPEGIIGIVINGIIIYYMTRPHVKNYFGV